MKSKIAGLLLLLGLIAPLGGCQAEEEDEDEGDEQGIKIEEPMAKKAKSHPIATEAT